jgi:hypothetical protein
MNDFYVYIGVHPDTEESCYIGKGRGQRIGDHSPLLKKGTHPNVRLQSIFDRHGPILWAKLHEGLSEREAFEIEKALVALLGRGRGKPLCNKTDGGDGTSGHKHTEEARARMSRAQKGHYVSPEARAKIGAAHRGKKLSPEHRAKFIAHNHEPKSPEHLAKIQAAKIGRPRSAETKQKLSEALKGRKQPARSPEYRKNISEHKKRWWAEQRVAMVALGMEPTFAGIIRNAQAKRAALKGAA